MLVLLRRVEGYSNEIEVDGEAVNVDRLRVLATEVTADAVRSAVASRPAEG